MPADPSRQSPPAPALNAATAMARAPASRASMRGAMPSTWRALSSPTGAASRSAMPTWRYPWRSRSKVCAPALAAISPPCLGRARTRRTRIISISTRASMAGPTTIGSANSRALAAAQPRSSLGSSEDQLPGFRNRLAIVSDPVEQDRHYDESADEGSLPERVDPEQGQAVADHLDQHRADHRAESGT